MGQGSEKPTLLKVSMKPNWNFLRGGVGGGGQTKKLSLGVMDIFFFLLSIIKKLRAGNISIWSS